MSKKDVGTGNGISVSLPGEHIDKAAAKIVDVVVGASAEGTATTLGNIFGGIVGDRIRDWRTRNLIRMAADMARLFQEMDIPLSRAKSLPMGDVYALFDGASKQDNEALSELWSNLLCSAMLENTEITETRAFVQVLEQLTPIDAKILELLRFGDEYDRQLGLILKEIDGMINPSETGPRKALKDLRDRLNRKAKQLRPRSVEFEMISIDNLMKTRCIAIKTANCQIKSQFLHIISTY